MTRLCELILECRAIKGMDRFVLYGWAAQLEEGNDTLYCSKETVAVFLGTSIDTVKRRTKSLLAAGWLVDTGDTKHWDTGWVPVLNVNVPMIASVSTYPKEKPSKLHGLKNPVVVGILPEAVQIAPPEAVQNALQGSNGSNGSRFTSFSSSLTCAISYSTGVPPVEEETKQSKSKEGEPKKNLEPKTENLKPARRFPSMATFPEPEPEPKPTPVAAIGKAGSKRVCKDCGEPLLRGVNHLLVCKGKGLLPNQMVEADRQKRGESIVMEKTTPLVAPRAADPPATPSGYCLRCGYTDGKHVNEPGMVCPVLKAKAAAGLKPPIPLAADRKEIDNISTPAPASIPCQFCGKAPRRNPSSDYCLGCWDLRKRTGIIPKLMDETTAGINP
jgi:hypothetical protein